MHLLGVGIVRVQLVYLELIVHRSVGHLVLLGVLQMADRAAGIGEDDTLRRDIEAQDL